MRILEALIRAGLAVGAVALLAEQLKLDAADAKRRLQALYDSGALELDLEGEDLVYRLKGEARAASSPQSEVESRARAHSE